MLGTLLELGASTDPIIIGIALIIIIGYIGGAVFRRTRIPEVLILMLIGIILVPVGNLIPASYLSVLKSLVPTIGAIALVVIMFNASKELKFNDRLAKNWKGVTFGILDTVISAIVLAFFMQYFLGWPLIYGAILGAIIGETTTVVVIPLIRGIKITSDLYNVIFVETTINAVASIVVFSLLLGFATGVKSFTLAQFPSYLLDYISVAVFLGIVAGIVWLFVIKTVKHAREYLATIAVALFLYGIVDLFNGAAIISVLIFAMIIGNEQVFAKYLNIKSKLTKKGETSVQNAIEFLIRTFFFVLMGMIIVLSVQYLIYGIIVTVIVVGIRYLETRTILYNNDPTEKKLVFALMPRGVTTATLAAIVFGIGGIFFSQIFYICFMVIVFTTILSSIMLSRTKFEVKK